MLSEYLNKYIQSQSEYIKQNGYGYGQVEPNHLTAQSTKAIYAQLPAKKDITILENGQFAKYDMQNECVDFNGDGEWLLVYNEVKLYRDGQVDAEFALIADNYQARVYSPSSGEGKDAQSRYYNGKDDKQNDIEDVTAAPDMYEPHYNEDPFHFEQAYKHKMMYELGGGTDAKSAKVNSMVPRLFKTYVGDIFTTNMLKDTEIALGDKLTPGASNGILAKDGADSADMQWKVVKIYTMPDGQPGVKLQRIK